MNDAYIATLNGGQQLASRDCEVGWRRNR